METRTLKTINILDPDLYVQRGYPQAEWTLLRRETPQVTSYREEPRQATERNLCAASDKPVGRSENHGRPIMLGPERPNVESQQRPEVLVGQPRRHRVRCVFNATVAAVSLTGCASVSLETQHAREERPFFQQEQETEIHGRKNWLDYLVEADPGPFG